MAASRLDRARAARSPELRLLCAVLVVVVTALLAVTWIGLETLSAVRAYVAGEGAYAKAQKDAVDHLVRYAASRDEGDYARFLEWIAVARAGGEARRALSTARPDVGRAQRALVAARNHPEDVASMVALFRRADWLPEMRRAIEIWTKADEHVDALAARADELHAEIAGGRPSSERVTALLADVRALHERLGQLEEEFSFTLGAGSRRVRQRMMAAAMLSSLVLVGIAVLIAARLIERLRRDELRFRSMIEHAHDVITIVRPDGTIVYESPAITRALGWGQDDLVGRNVMELVHPDDVTHVVAAIGRVFQDPGTSQSAEFRFRHADGSWRILEATGGSMPGTATVSAMVVSTRDVTDRRELEARLAGAQKLESIGRLAGGVAHDFNNLLTAIVGSAEMARAALPPGSRARDDLDEVLRSGERAADLTRQLLAFARRQVIEPRVFELVAVLRDMEPMLRRLVGADVALRIEEAAQPASVRADPGQIQRVVMNLAVNARDAMPEGGALTLAVSRVHVAADDAALAGGGASGDLVRLEVRDTGIAMSEEVRARAFEPFFTTKDPGKGTGLGLATCYGIVTQSGGTIAVRSETGRGTSVLVHLPYVPLEGEPVGARPPDAPPLARGETVLLVEDEPAVRRIAERALREHGYRVIACANGTEALAEAERAGEVIDLLLSDVVMPKLGGRALAEHLRRTRPDLLVLLMSGYTDDAGLTREIESSGLAFLHKPFAPAELCRKVRAVLDGEKSEPAGVVEARSAELGNRVG